MDTHRCLLCMGSNSDGDLHLRHAREALTDAFPGIHFGMLMITDAVGSTYRSPFYNQLAVFSTDLTPEYIHRRCKKIEREEGRSREDKRTGIVKLDIDLLKYDRRILKKEDMKRDYILEGIKGM